MSNHQTPTYETCRKNSVVGTQHIYSIVQFPNYYDSDNYRGRH